MTNEKHTPGPWVIQRNDTSISDDGLIRIQSRSGDPHAAVFPAIHDDAATAEANARLISAAPDLLEIARRLAEHFPPLSGGELFPQDIADWLIDGGGMDATRAALAKARGES